jgi:hypothetical protein
MTSRIPRGRAPVEPLVRRHQHAYNAGVADDRQLAARFQTAVDLWATGVALRRQSLRRSHPAASDEEIERLLNKWLQDRPGAEAGDGPSEITP